MSMTMTREVEVTPTPDAPQRPKRRTGALQNGHRLADRRPPLDSLDSFARAVTPVLDAQSEAVRDSIRRYREAAALSPAEATRRVNAALVGAGAGMTKAAWSRLEHEPGRAGKLSIDRLNAILYVLGQTPMALAARMEQAVADLRVAQSQRPLPATLAAARARRERIRHISDQLAVCPDDTLAQIGGMVEAMVSHAQIARARMAAGPAAQPTPQQQIDASLNATLDELDDYEQARLRGH